MVDFSPIVATTVLDFIDYAAFVVIFLIIYYGIKFLMFQTKDEEDAEKARIDSARDWVGKKVEDYKTKREADDKKLEEEAKVRARKRLLEPAKGWVIKALQHADEVSDNLNAAGLSRAKSHVKSVKENLHSAKRIIRAARIHVKGDRRDYLNNLAARIELLEVRLINNIERPFPLNATVPGFSAKITSIRSHLNTIKTQCDLVIKSIDEFIEEDKVALGAMGGGAGPSPSPGVSGYP